MPTRQRTLPVRTVPPTAGITLAWIVWVSALTAGCADRQLPTQGDVGRADRATVIAPSKNSGVTVQLLDVAGVERLIARHRGRVVVLDCWSTSCPPCMQEFPRLVSLHHRYGAEQLACISLSFDYEGLGTPEDVVPKVQKFLDAQQATFDNVVCRDDSDTLYAHLDLAAIPAVFVYDRAGKLRQKFDNSAADRPPFSYADVEPVVRELLGQTAAEERAPAP